MGRARSRGAWSGAALALLVLGSSFLLSGLRAADSPLAQAESAQSMQLPRHASKVGGPTAPPQPAGAIGSVAQPRVPHSTPVRLVIPALHLDVRLTKLGLNTDGTVEVPSDPDLPGWFSLGPSPAQQGSAVILGHVDSYSGPAVFYTLRYITPGDAITVVMRNGSVAHFVVKSTATYPNAEFPNERVYTSHGYAGLQLVTCGGGFDTVAGHYLGNFVVYTRLVTLSPPPVRDPVDVAHRPSAD